MANNFGELASLVASPCAGVPVSYVWELWDGEVRTTNLPATQKILSRDPSSFQLTAVDAFGQSIVLNASAASNAPPILTGGSFGGAAQPLPYAVSLSATATDTSGSVNVAWLDSDGNVLSLSNPYSHTVTSESEVLYVRLTEAADATSLIAIDFTLAGRVNQQPKLTPLTFGQAPESFTEVLPPVYVATTANITLAGMQTIDSAPVPLGARVLVKNQSSLPQNGPYITGSGSWTRAADSVQPGTTVRVLSGGQAGKFFAVTQDANPDALVLGTSPVTWDQVHAQTQGIIASDSYLYYEAATREPDNQDMAYSVQLLTGTVTGSLPKNSQYAFRAKESIAAQTVGLKDVAAAVQDTMATPAKNSRVSVLKLG